MRVVNTRIFCLLFLTAEVDVSAFAASNPIALALEHLLRPGAFDLLDVRDELLGIFSDAQKPLLQVSFLDRGATAPTDASRTIVHLKAPCLPSDTS